MMKIFLTLLICALATVAAWWFVLRAPDIANYPAKEGPILAFGDSLVQGVGASEEKDFVSLLSKGLGEEVLNFGVSGNTTAQALERVDAALAKEPRIAIILLGGNDYLKRTDKTETFTNLRTIIKKFQDSGAITVVLGVRGGLLADNYAGDYKKLANETHSLYVSDVLDDLLGNKEYMSDQIHPNDAGYAIIAQRVFDALQPVLK